MLASLELEISTEFWTPVKQQVTNNLPQQITRGTEFIPGQDTHNQGYYVTVAGRSVTVEYINRHWYYLEYKSQHNSYITRADLALTKEQLVQHGLACKVQPPVTNILIPWESTEVLPPNKDDNTPTKGKGKAKSVVSNDSDKESYQPA